MYFTEIKSYTTYSGEEDDFHFNYNANSGGGQAFLGGRFYGADGELTSPETLDGNTALFCIPYVLDDKQSSILINDDKTKYEIKPRGEGSSSMKLAIGKDRVSPSRAIAAIMMLPVTCGVKMSSDLQISILTRNNYWLQSMWLDCQKGTNGESLLTIKDCVFGGGINKTISDGSVRYFKLNLQERIKDVILLSSKSSCFSDDISSIISFFSDLYQGKKPFSYEECSESIIRLMELLSQTFPIEYSGITDPLPLLIKIANDYSEQSVDSETDSTSLLTPEWFKAKCQPFLYLDAEAASERDAFMKKYSPELLRELEGIALLRTIFLNDENKDNLCYHLEFNKALRDIFGSIRSGTAYKYGLHFSQKNKSWATGSGNKPQLLTEDEAVELGTQIRDYLVLGADIIKNYGEINSLEDYSKLYTELYKATEGYINRVWFLKYYQMIYPSLFPPIYSSNAQNTVLTAIGERSGENPIIRMGQLQLFIRTFDISPVVFSRTFWANSKAVNDDSSDIREDTLVPIRFYTGLDIQIPRNRILFGAPGTGKSFTLKTEAKELLGAGNEEDYERVTFHPDYSYANFVGTYKPVPHRTESGEDTITYAYVPGPFMRVYVNALKNSQTGTIKPFLLIIEEINRANVAAVFGDVFQLLDRGDDDVSEFPIQASEDIKAYLASELGGQPDDYSKIRIPDNMFIWATMNSADQGVYPVDTAFKRRWDFTYLGIDDSEDGIKGKTVILGRGQYTRVVEWNKLRKLINAELLTYKVNEDKLLGPYFIAKKNLPDGDVIDPAAFIRIFKNKIIMYLFEDAAKQRRSALFGGCNESSKNQYSKICSEFDEKGVFIFCEAISREFIEKPSEDVEQ